MDISELSTAALYELRVQVNNEIADIEQTAQTCLDNGKEFPGFALKPGKVSRFIQDTESYEKLLNEHLGSLATKTSYIALTAAEKIVKEQYDEEDAEWLKGELAKTYGTKASNPTLVYTGEDKDG